MSEEYDFSLAALDEDAIDIALRSESQRVMQYISDCARHMGITPDELIESILMEWAYNRKIGGV